MKKKSQCTPNGPLFPIEELSPDTFIKLPKRPNAESGSAKLYIILAEPNLYVEGFNKDETNARPPSVLRGALFLRITKPVKIKSINLTLTGTSRTEWPEGIPPKRCEYHEASSLINHSWSFFSYQNPPAANNGADIFIPRTEDELHELIATSSHSNLNQLSPVASYETGSDLLSIKSPTSLMSALIGSTSSSSLSTQQQQQQQNSSFKSKSKSKFKKNVLLSTFRSNSNVNLADHDILSPQVSSGTIGTVSGNDDNKHFDIGDYIYSFELPIAPSLPETITVSYGSNLYHLEAFVERSGKFKTNLSARRSINIVRTPFQDSSEENQPIIINREWESKLQYDIVIYSKQIVLNSYLPISFRMIPLEKVKVHRIRVYITEHLDYYCHNKKVHRTEPPKKVLLLEHKPPEGSDNLLALNDDEIGGMELDFQVFIPEFYGQGRRLHAECDTDNIQSHHWIKICIRISKSEPTREDPTKRKQYELTIDSPMHLLSPLCAHANTLLPSYDDQIQMDAVSSQRVLDSDIDKMMSPSKGTILNSNLFKPNDNVPVEMLTPQAKPFSPIASPQLNAINPELRDSRVLTPIDMLEMLSPSNSSSTLNVIPPPVMHIPSRSTTPVFQRSNSSLLISSKSSNQPPPPPFAEKPPTYDEATRKSTSNLSLASSKSDSQNSRSRSTSNSTSKSNSKPKQKSFDSKSKSNDIKSLAGLSSATKYNAGIENSSKHTTRSSLRHREADLSGAGDQPNDELHGLSFHITPIKSADTSPDHSPVRSSHTSKLVNKSFTPAFSWGPAGQDTLDAALARLKLGNEQDEHLGLLEADETNGDVSELCHGNASTLTIETIDTLSTQAPIAFNNRKPSAADVSKLFKSRTEASVDITDM